MSAPTSFSQRALRPSPRIGAAVSPDLGARMTLSLARAARTSALAASDAEAVADRTDELAYACRHEAGEGIRGRAQAVRDYADGLKEAAAWCERCAAIPRLPALVAAIEAGAHVWTDDEPASAESVVVRSDVDAAGPLSMLKAWARFGRDLLSRRAA